ncbi:hypothetical protein AX17_005583, partial [Amanita inopinata Kibby_2008]
MPVIHIGENLPSVFRIFILLAVVFLASIVAGLLAYGIVAMYHGYKKRQWFKAIEKVAEDLETRRIDYKAKKPILVLPPATFSVNPVARPVPAHFSVRHKLASSVSVPVPLVRHTAPVSPINKAASHSSRSSQFLGNDSQSPLVNPEVGKQELGVVSVVSNNVADSSVAVPSCQPRLATVVAGGTVTGDADVDVDAKTSADEDGDTLGPLPDIVTEKQRKQERRKVIDWKKRKNWILDGIAGARAAVPSVKLQLRAMTKERAESDADSFLADTEQKCDALSILPVFATKKRTKLSKKKTGIIVKRTNNARTLMAISAAVPS